MPAVRRPARPLTAAALVATASLAALAGCGNAKQASPDVRTPGPAFGSERVPYASAGLTLLRAPAGWARSAGVPPAVATIATGEATIGIFRYPRTEPLPRTKAQLDAAATALVAAAKARDPTFTEIKRARLKVDGRPAVQIRGTETIDGQPRTVRTTHVYAFGAELVIDAYAPEKDFRRVDKQVFMPLLAGVRLRRPATPKPAATTTSGQGTTGTGTTPATGTGTGAAKAAG
ncbi:hypothetical protein NBH00_14575 [Paraconexibacter antarcticus]|uniref:Lipoprotein n=1 Tax=Paraconexibacter antarcticus TaxID=2949664 RepID=A0ABY5DL93_9ACTN|nr:hypothetical protein [Paraconexibacter antarcticus]UTI62585.1 hypothetical protein NBH00_14575 [Paraconexibacter antarcticus]